MHIASNDSPYVKPVEQLQVPQMIAGAARCRPYALSRERGSAAGAGAGVRGGRAVSDADGGEPNSRDAFSGCRPG
jgi:hypothetical protein